MKKIILAANTDWYLFNFRLSLARYLREAGFDVILVSPPGKYAQKLIEQGYSWHAWPVTRQSISPVAELPAVFKLARLYRLEKPDLVHHHTIKPVLYGSLAARWARVPGVVNSITGLGYVFISQQARARMAGWAARSLYRQAFQNPQTVAIFENESDRDFFLQQGFLRESQTRLIASVGVETERFTPTSLPPGSPVVVMAGRLLGDKGVHTFVEAARILGTRVAARFVLVGVPDAGNPTSIPVEQIETWVREGIVEWWGWQEDMQVVYAQSHLVVLPSLGEGVPVVLLEAAACGRAIVASDVPGCREVVSPGFNGLLVPVNDVPALAHAMQQLIGDPALCSRMGSYGRRLVEERFTAAVVNAATLAVYRQILPGDGEQMMNGSGR
jgi:glycosyltransferase involved in cell wall biosynthesis